MLLVLQNLTVLLEFLNVVLFELFDELDVFLVDLFDVRVPLLVELLLLILFHYHELLVLLFLHELHLTSPVIVIVLPELGNTGLCHFCLGVMAVIAIVFHVVLEILDDVVNIVLSVPIWL
jgi:hypothetical protein